MQIRIYLDGTFESLSAADTKAQLTALKNDLKIITKVERLRAARTDAKRMANAAKDKELLAKIKALKATLSSNRNSSIEIVKDKIAKLGAAPAAKPDLKAKLAARQTKAVRAPKKPSNSEERVKAARPARQTAKVKERLRDLETKIGILEHDLSKVPKGAKYNLRREMLSENLADAKKQVQSLERTGKEAVLPARTSAPTKRRIARESTEDAVGRKKRQAIELITDKMAQTRDPAKLAALKAQLLKAQTGPDRAPLTKEERATRDANKKPLKPRSKSKDEKALDRVHEAENALIKYRENKSHSVHDKIRPGDKVAKAESREMEQLMADLPEAKANYRKMPKSEHMQKARDNAKKMIDAMEKRLDMLKAKYIGSAKK